MQEKFLKLLRAQPTLSDLLAVDTDSDRPMIDWVTRPDGGNYPAITLTTITGTRDLNQGSTTKLRSTRVQFDFWGSDNDDFGGGYSQTLKAFRAVDDLFAAIDGHHPSFVQDNIIFKKVLYENDRDMPVTDAAGGERVFHHEADFIVWWLDNSS